MKKQTVKGKNENRKARHAMYQRVIELEEEISLRENNDHRINLRFPSEVSNKIKEDCAVLAKELGVSMSQNDYIVYILLHYCNMQQTSTGKIIQKQDGLRFRNYLEAEKKKWVEHKKELLFSQRT